LQARGLSHPELIDRFRLGYANRTLGLRLPEKTRKAGADIRARLERIGVYRASGHEHFNGSLVVPVLDEAGAVAELYGRKLRDDLRPGTPLHLYLPGPHRGVWNLPGVAASAGEIILTEALIDAMSVWCAGYRNVTAAYGVEGFTEDHLAALRRHDVRRVLIAFDRDLAGDRGAAKVAQMLMAAGVEAYRIEFPKGMDANAYALKVTPAGKSLGVLIRKAVWLGQGKAPARPSPGTPIETASAAEPVEIETVSTIPLAAKEEEPATPAPALPAARVPEASQAVAATVGEAEVTLNFGDRRWRVRGLARNLAYDVLKVNLLASCGEAFHIDTLDLYNARARASFITQAAVELQTPDDVLKSDLGRVLLKLEALQDEAIRTALEPKLAEAHVLDEGERAAALALLTAPDLAARILADFEACGVVGEATNKLVGYLAAVSRKLASPLAVVIQSSSAAGKSVLMDAVLAFAPPEERVQYSAMTGQSLFYMGETNLKHRILAIAEEEGASRASYALKLLQSEGELTIASTGTDPKTGNLVTQEYRVEGPTMLMMTTTAIDIDEELMNRCLVLAVDEAREQTRAIHRLQREKRTLAGLVRRQETRRDHEKYLTLIDAITLLHQHQRPVRTAAVQGQPIEYVEATLADIALANRLAHEVLGRSLDELPPQTRRVLAAVQAPVRGEAEAKAIRPGEVRFSRADIRRRGGLADTQCRLHLDRLASLEYLLTHRGRRGQSFEYELLYDGAIEDCAPRLAGLIEVDTLRSGDTTTSSRGSETGLAGSSRGHGGPIAAPSRVAPPPTKPGPARGSAETVAVTPESHPLRVNGDARSYAQNAVIPPLAASA
jgi:hypothetical protein